MAGVSDLSAAPYPNGPVTIVLGGFLPNGCAAQELQRYVLPFDAKVKSVRYSYHKTTAGSGADLDAVTLVTVDAAKNLVAAADMSANIEGAKQTLHADIIDYQIKTGDAIRLLASSDGSNEAGAIFAQIELDPVYTRPPQA